MLSPYELGGGNPVDAAAQPNIHENQIGPKCIGTPHGLMPGRRSPDHVVAQRGESLCDVRCHDGLVFHKQHANRGRHRGSISHSVTHGCSKGVQRIERAYGQLVVSFNVVFDPQSFGTGAAAREVPGWYSYQMSEHQVAPRPRRYRLYSDSQ